MNESIAMDQYLVVIERTATGYSAYSPDVPGCITTGESVEETTSNMREALTLHLEMLRSDGDPLPLPRGAAGVRETEALYGGEDYLLTYIEMPSAAGA